MEKNYGCLGAFFKIGFLLFFIYIIVATYYYTTSNSIKAVQETNFNEISYLLYMPISGGDKQIIYRDSSGNAIRTIDGGYEADTYKIFHEKKIEGLKDKGFSVNDDLIDILNNNLYVSNLNFQIVDSIPEIDSVKISFDLKKDNKYAHVEMFCLVKEKKFSEGMLPVFLGLFDINITSKDYDIRYSISKDDDTLKDTNKMFEILTCLYDSKSTEMLINKFNALPPERINF